MKIIFIVGPHGSGKTSVATEMVLNSKRAILFDTGPVIRGVHQISSPDLNILDWINEVEKKKGPNATDELIFENINSQIFKSNDFELVMITGYRTLPGLKYLKSKLFDKVKSPSCLIYVDSIEEFLRQRYNKREGLNLSFWEFRKILLAQEEKLLELKQESDFIIYNNSSRESFFTNFRSIISYLD